MALSYDFDAMLPIQPPDKGFDQAFFTKCK